MNRYFSRLFSITTILALMLMALPMQGVAAAGTVSLMTLGTIYAEDFNTLATSGTANTALPMGWDLSESGTSTRNNGAYAASTGSDTAGDVYSFGASGNAERAYGTLLSGTLTPTIGAQFTNNTGSTIASLDISYVGEMWRAGVTNRNAADRIDFQLSTNATSLTSGDWVDYDSLDFNSPNINTSVGLLDGNLAGNRTALSFTITGMSITNGSSFWIRWTDFNISSSDDGLSVDDFSLTPNGGVTPINLSVNDVSANEGNAGTTSFDFTVSLSAPAGPGGVTFDIATADDTATVADNDYVAQSLTGQTIPEGSSSYMFSVTVNGDTNTESNETFFVNVTSVTGATLADGQGVGTIVNDDVVITFIHGIQGSGGTVTGSGPFTVEAIVVGDFQTQGSGELRGFFIQEEDADADANPDTSEGIFVFCSACPTDVSVGDKVQVTGNASDFFGMSQLSATTAGSVNVIGSGNTLPTPASIDLPASGSTRAELTFENVEGMLVTFTDELVVSEYFELARFGQLVLTADARPSQFTDANEPSVSGYAAFLDDLNSKRIILDDDNNTQNDAIEVGPDEPYYWPRPGLSITNFFRGGDSITGLTGILEWSFSAWRVRPVEEAFIYNFASNNERTETPDNVGGSLKVASFNVLNYFLTIDTTASNNVGTCGPSGTLDCRGADSAQELGRQRTKLLAALTAIDADILGLIEMENTPGVDPLADIVAGLPGYSYIDTGAIGTDAIRVGIIYKTSTVTPVGDYAILDSSVDPHFDDTRNRPALAQTFMSVDTGGVLTVVVNHLKSKSGSELDDSGAICVDGDPGNDIPDCDQGDGQAYFNATRVAAAQALVDWLATDPTGSGDVDALIIGDLNSYAKEDPIAALQNSGYTDLVAAFSGPNAYSYLFDGQLGYLDHALANPSLNPQVVGVTEWHINADEIPLFDYNDDVRDTGEASFEEESDVNMLYEPNPFRTSDHDPVIVGLDLLHYDFSGFFPPVDNYPVFNSAKAGSSVAVRFSLDGNQGLNIFLNGYPLSREIACDTGTIIDGTEQAATAGGSSLTYNPSTDEYTFVWKTNKSWAGTCRQLVVILKDGSIHLANFSFK